MSHPHRPGRHELGQNFLTDPRVIAHVVRLAAASRGPLVEWGAGDGALTRPLGELGRPLEGVEIDPQRAARLRHRVGPDVTITEGELLRHAPPRGSTVVGNVPFHITTPCCATCSAATAGTGRSSSCSGRWRASGLVSAARPA